MYQTDPKSSTLCLLLIRYKSRVKYDERATNKGLLKESKFHLRHLRQKNLSISKPFVKPTKLSIEQLVIIVSLSISCFHFCSFMRPTQLLQLTGGSTQTFTPCQKAPANSINSIIYMTRITTKARNSVKSGTKVFLHVENNIDELVRNNKKFSANKLRQGIYCATC